ncbi:hypothetical protein LINPERHAP1_LOCUS16869 [Linum perenne]
MTFTDAAEVRTAIKKHAITERKDVTFEKNEPKRIRLKCKRPGCRWKFFVSHNKRFNSLQLKKYRSHSCSEHYKNKWVNTKTVADRYKMRIRSNPKWKNKHIRETVREDFGADISLMQCSRAKAVVLRKTMSCYKEEYALLRAYGEAILRTNPGSTVKIKVDVDNPEQQPLFQRMYICFDALRKGFLAGCRRIVSLDGSFMKGLCKGEVLSAIGRDANDQMYPIAWCIVEVESRDSWDWFLELLQLDLDIGEGGGWCFASDQQKGLVPSIANLFPNAEHRLCARHIYANWRKRFQCNKWQKMFWKCAKATTEPFFNLKKEELITANPAAAEAMVVVDPKHWARAFFSTDIKCDSVDNNMSESFNSLILEARHKPIYSMLEDIRTMCLEMISVKRGLANKWRSSNCPKILKKLAKNAAKSRFCHILSNGKDGYEVRYKANRFCVHVRQMKCSCRAWDLSGIPCAHAITCISSEGLNPEDYISPWFTVDKYNQIYDHVMDPMDGPKSWPRSDYAIVLPPAFRAMPGRPKKNRVQAVEEKEDKMRKKRRRIYERDELLTRDNRDSSKLGRVGRVMSCKSCKGEGHNRRTCPLLKEQRVRKHDTSTSVLSLNILVTFVFVLQENRDGGSGSGLVSTNQFQGFGAYTNEHTGRTVLNVCALLVASL